MKMKKILMLVLGLSLAGCQLPKMEKMMWHSVPENKTVRVAVMLPLSGKSANTGKAFQNTMMMALQEYPNSAVELMFFDTKGTAEGVKESWEVAEGQKPDLIVGPVLAEEVQALKSEVSVPIISFTTDHSVLKKEVYSLGVLIPSQVDRVVQSMCVAGHRKIAVMGPENKTGELTMNALSEAVQRCPGMALTQVSLYEPETVNFTPAVLKIVPAPIDPKKKNLTEEEKKLLDMPMAERVEFDSLFVYDSGVKLQQVISLLAYYDVTPKVVPFYGLGVWQSSQDRGLVQGYYAAAPDQKVGVFMKRYQQSFGEKPQKIATLGYDAISLVQALSDENGWHPEHLTQESGFNGVNGRFRLLDNGMNERLLDVYQIMPGMKSKVVDSAPAEFQDPASLFVDAVFVDAVSEEKTGSSIPTAAESSTDSVAEVNETEVKDDEDVL